MKRAAVIWTLSMFVAITSARDTRRSWNFDTVTVEKKPDGFVTAAGEWKVVADSTAPSRPNVLAQLGKSSGSTFNLTLVSNTHYKDIDISVKLKAVAGRIDQGGGLVWRAKDEKNYYIARYNPLEENYRVYKVENGRRSQFQSANIKRTDGWQLLRVTMTGDHIQCYYDGKKYLDVRDSTFRDAGKIGLWTKSDAQTYFDDLMASGN